MMHEEIIREISIYTLAPPETGTLKDCRFQCHHCSRVPQSSRCATCKTSHSIRTIITVYRSCEQTTKAWFVTGPLSNEEFLLQDSLITYPGSYPIWTNASSQLIIAFFIMSLGNM
jgi:hypothetical protein